MRNLLYVLVGLIALLVGAAALGPAFVDWNGYKQDITAEVRAATGRSLVIKGDIALSLLPSPSLTASDVRLLSESGEQADMLRLGALEVEVRLLPLLGGEVEVTRMVLVEPVLVFEVGKDGKHNWEARRTAPAGTEARPGKPAAAEASSDTTSDPGAFRLNRLQVVKGTVIYKDAGTGVERSLHNISAEISAGSLAGPFEIRAALASRNTPLKVQARMGSFADRNTAPVDLQISLADDDEAKIGFKGRVSDLRSEPKLTGTLSGGFRDLSMLAAAFAASDEEERRFAVWRGRPLAVKGRLEISMRTATLNDLSLDVAGTRATGGVSIGYGKETQVDVALRMGQVDFDVWRHALGAADGPAGGRAAPRPKKPAASGSKGFILPRDLGGSVDLSVRSLKYQGRSVRNIKIAASLAKGKMTVKKATARFPGGGVATVSGLFTDRKGKPRFVGKFVARASKLRAVLDWFKVGTDGVAPGRLGRFRLTTKVRVDPDNVHLTDMDLRLDSSRIKGGVTYALRSRPSFGASLAIDKLNLDAYLPVDGASRKASQKPRPRAKAKKPARAAPPLVALKDFDANLVMRVENLTYRNTPIKGAFFDGTLHRGKLTIKEVGARNLGGASARLKGTLRRFEGFPVFKGSFGGEAKSVAGLYRLAGVKPAVSAAKLGTVKLNGSAEGDAKNLKLDVTLGALGGEFSVGGKIADYRTKPGFDMNVRARFPDARRLVAALGGEDFGTAGKKQAMKMSAALKGTVDAFDLRTELSVAGGSASLTGKIASPMTEPAIEFELSAEHPDFAALMRELALGYRPAAKQLGALRLAARVSGKPEKLTFAGLRAAVGPVEIAGEGELAFGGDRPVLTAKLSASDIVIDPLLAAEGEAAGKGASGKRPGKGVNPSGKFSRDPLDLAALGDLDADVTLNAKSITFGKMRMADPTIAATLKDRVLTIARADGKMFGGGVTIKGTLSGAGTPRLKATAAIKGADLTKLLMAAADTGKASGKVDFDLDITGAGKTEHDLVANLNGEAAFHARDGAVEGFNLKAASDRMRKAKGADILTLLITAISGGSTRYSTFDGTFQIKKGVARTKDIKLVAEAGEGTATGTIDLPRWNMNVNTVFRLTEHAKAPPFEMRLKGPIESPRQIFRFKQLQAYLLRRSVRQLLKKAPPKPKPKPAAPAVPSEPKPKKLRPEDILRGLLKGLQ